MPQNMSDIFGPCYPSKKEDSTSDKWQTMERNAFNPPNIRAEYIEPQRGYYERIEALAFQIILTQPKKINGILIPPGEISMETAIGYAKVLVDKMEKLKSEGYFNKL
jgi:hypothetical protein